MTDMGEINTCMYSIVVTNTESKIIYVLCKISTRFTGTDTSPK